MDVADRPILIDIRQLASLLSCSTRHVRRLVDAGRLMPPIRLGTLPRWDRHAIARWIATGCPPLDEPREPR